MTRVAPSLPAGAAEVADALRHAEYVEASFAVENMKSDRRAGFGVYAQMSEVRYTATLLRAMQRRAEAAAALQEGA